MVDIPIGRCRTTFSKREGLPNFRLGDHIEMTVNLTTVRYKITQLEDNDDTIIVIMDPSSD